MQGVPLPLSGSIVVRSEGVTAAYATALFRCTGPRHLAVGDVEDGPAERRRCRGLEARTAAGRAPGLPPCNA